MELYGQGPVKPFHGVYEALAVLMAAYKATGDRQHLDLMQRVVQGFALEIDEEVAKNPTQIPGPGLSASVVRDVTQWVLPAAARMGQNWTLGEVGTVGTHWVNAWTPKVLDGHYGYRTKEGGFYAPVSPSIYNPLVQPATPDHVAATAGQPAANFKGPGRIAPGRFWPG